MSGSRSGKHTDSRAWRHLYQTQRWRRLRQQVFMRDHYICQICNKLCAGQGRNNPHSPVCDHVEEHRGNPKLFFDLANLQTLHKQCHDQAKRRAELSGYDGTIGADGWPVSDDHPFNQVGGGQAKS